MNTTVFNKTLTLQKLTAGTGRNAASVAVSKRVRASVRLPTISFVVKAEAAGRKVDMIATIRRRDYEEEHWTHADFEGTEYRIESTNAAEKDMFVRLSLRRS